jgi:hypothetical protein
VRNFEVSYSKLNAVGFCTMVIKYKNGSLNFIIINLLFLEASPYGLSHLKESGCHKFSP